MTSQRRTLTLVVMCVGMFLVLLDVTIVNVALPRLRAELGAGVRSLQWIVDGYGVALASLMLPCADLGDRHGHKRVVLAGLAAFGRVRWRPGWPPGRRSSWPVASCRARAPRSCSRHARGRLARLPTPASGAGHRDLGGDLVLRLPAGVIAGGALVERPGLALGLPRQPPARRRRVPVTARVVVESREPSPARPTSRVPPSRWRCWPRRPSRSSRARPRPRGRRRAARRPWSPPSAGVASRCSPRRSSAGRLRRRQRRRAPR